MPSLRMAGRPRCDLEDRIAGQGVLPVNQSADAAILPENIVAAQVAVQQAR